VATPTANWSTTLTAPPEPRVLSGLVRGVARCDDTGFKYDVLVFEEVI
jgi:hypothetical protein